jgi:glycosyltransferase involved in cell wall biosynthesis
MPIWLEITLFALYVLLGPLTWGFMILAMFEGRRRMSVLLKKTAPLPDPAPRLTVLIPARNEEANIEKCLAGVMGQDYPNMEVVVADDRSTDATGAILDRLAGVHRNLHVVHCTDADRIPGWTGKNNAMHQAYEKGVKGRDGGRELVQLEYLLGLDSDVRLTRADALSVCVRAAIKHKAGILTLLPALESGTFFEGLVIPLTGMLSSSINAISLTNVDSFKKVAYANGQYLMFRRDVYDAIGGHAQVGPLPCEDVPLAYLVKNAGERVRVAWGAELCAVRMYDSLGAVYRGLARVLSVSRNRKTWPMWAGIAFLLLCGFSLYPAIVYGLWRMAHPLTKFGAMGWLVACGVHFAAMTVQLGLMYAWSKNRWWNALLFPVGGGISLAIYCKALKQCFTGKIEWRGVNYSLKQSAPVAKQV